MWVNSRGLDEPKQYTCGFGFIIADYNNYRARYRGQGKQWKQQPLISDPFLTKVEAIEAAGKHLSLQGA